MGVVPDLKYDVIEPKGIFIMVLFQHPSDTDTFESTTPFEVSLGCGSQRSYLPPMSINRQ